MEITEHEQFIYNLYLRLSRSTKNKAYKLRKDFSKLNDELQIRLLKLSHFFKRVSYVVPEEFFLASFQLYPDENLDIKHFLTPRALKAHSIFQKEKNNNNPDSAVILQKIANGINFINSFCKEKRITIEEYSSYRSQNTLDFFIHLRENKISIYNMFYFNFDRYITQDDRELLSVIFDNNYINNFAFLRSQYLTSKKCKLLVEMGMKKLINANGNKAK